MKEQDLTLVGLTEDKQQLVLVSDAGEEFTLPADARLRAALRGEHARLGQLEITMDSALRPRDIQARIRAGESPEHVAGRRADHRRQDHGLRHPGARRARPRRRPGPARLGPPQGRRRARPGSLGDAVAERLRARNVDPATVEWDAWRREDGRWTLVADYRSGESARHARVRLRRPGPLRRRRGRRGPLAGRRADRRCKGPQPRTAAGAAPALRGDAERAAARRGRHRAAAGRGRRSRRWSAERPSPPRTSPRPRRGPRHRRRRLDRHPGRRAPRPVEPEPVEPRQPSRRAEPTEPTSPPSRRARARRAGREEEEPRPRCRAGTRSCSAAASDGVDAGSGRVTSTSGRVPCPSTCGWPHGVLRHRRDRVHRSAPGPGAARQPRGRDLRPGPRGLAGAGIERADRARWGTRPGRPRSSATWPSRGSASTRRGSSEHRGEIDHFFHLAAIYDMTAADELNEQLNVGGTRAALELAGALRRRAASTRSPRSRRPATTTARSTRRCSTRARGCPRRTTARSSSPSGSCARSATVPWRVYRPAIVVGHSETGAMDKVDGPYYFFPLIKRLRDTLPAWLPLVGVDLGDTNVVPVDYVAKAMDHLAHLPGPRRRGLPPRQPRAAARRRRWSTPSPRPPGAPQFAVPVDRRVTGRAADEPAPPRRCGPLRLVQQRCCARRRPSWCSTQTIGRLGIPPEVLEHISFPTGLRLPPHREGAGRLRHRRAPTSRATPRTLWSYWEEHLDQSTPRATPAIARARSTGKYGRDHRRLLRHRPGRRAQGRPGRRHPDPGRARQGQARGHQGRRSRARGGTRVRLRLRPLRPRGDRRALRRSCAAEQPSASTSWSTTPAARSGARCGSREDRFHDFERTMQLNYFGAIRLVMGLLPDDARAAARPRREHLLDRRADQPAAVQRRTSPRRPRSTPGATWSPPSWSATAITLHQHPHAAGADADDRADQDLRQVPHDLPGAGRRPGDRGDGRAAARDQHRCSATLGAVAHTLAPEARLPGAAPGLPGVPGLGGRQGRGLDGGPASREQIMLAKVFKGVHW